MFERKGYVYKFIDEYNQVLYVGKTTDLNRRMNQHFNQKNNYLIKQGKGEVYKKTQRIEYFACKTEYDALVKELFYINYYKPKYNTASKIRQILDPPKEKDNWKLYREIKPLKKENVQVGKKAQKWLPVAMMFLFISILALYFI